MTSPSASAVLPLAPRAARFVEAVALGATYDLAARYAGFDDSTFRRYMSDDRPEFQAFRTAVRKAEAEGALVLLGRIHEAAVTDWRPAAWILEHRHQKDYGRQRLEVTGADGGQVQPLTQVILLPRTMDSAEDWADMAQREYRDRQNDPGLH